jgi:hypothetical protein
MKKIILLFFLLLIISTAGTAQSVKILGIEMPEDSSITESINLEGRYFTGVRLPAGWTGTEITLQDSWDGADSSFQDVYWSDGTEVSFTVAEDRSIKMFPWDVLALGPFIKIRSGNTATPVAQTADMDLTVETSGLK